MSANLAPTVVKHTLVTAQKNINGGTQTFVHPGHGNARLVVAVRFRLGASGDRVDIDIKQRIPGRNSDAAAEDYYDDESIIAKSLRVLGDTAGTGSKKYYSTGTNQEIFSISPFHGGTEWVITYTLTEASAVDVLAVTSWSTNAGAY